MVDFRIDVVVNPSGASRGARQVQRDLNEVENSANRVRGALARAFAFVGGAAVFTQAVRGALQYQTAIAEVSSLVDTATFDIERLNQQALENARLFGSPPSTQAAAFYSIISAGAGTASEAIETLDAANRAAVAGVTDVQTAATGISSVLNAYGLAASEAADVSDTFFIGVREGQTTFDQLANTVGRVTPIAAAAGVSFQEVTAAVAALTTGGISTAEAVTGLRATLQQIIQPSNATAGAAADLGLEFSAAALEAQGFQAFLANIIAATGGNTDALAELFGSVEALNAVLAFTGQAGQQFNSILSDLENRAGATQTAFDALAASPAFQLDRITQGLSAAAIESAGALTQALVPALTFVADNLDIVVNAIETLVILLGVQLVRVAIPAAITAFTTLATVIRANPIGVIALAISTAIAALIAFREQIFQTGGAFDELGTNIGAFLSLIQEVFGNVIAAIVSVFPTIGEFRVNWETVADAVITAIEMVVNAVDFIVAAFAAAAQGVVAAWNNLPAAFVEIATAALNGAISIVESGVNTIINLINSIPFVADVVGEGGFGNVEFGRVGAEGGVETPIADAFGTAFEAQRGAITDRFEELRQAATEAQRLGDTLSEVTTPAVQQASEALAVGEESLSGAARKASDSIDELDDKADESSSLIGDAFESAFNAASNALSNFIRTGEFDFSQFVRGILADINRLAVNQLFQSLLGGGGGGLFGGAGGGLLGGLFGFQNGGSFNVGGSGGPDSQLVAFRASPRERVDISTPGQQRQRDAAAAVGGRNESVNLRIVNQIDPSETLAAIESPAGERTILNVIERNPATVSRILSR